MSWIKISAINILVTLALLLIIEVGARAAWTVKVCYTNSCDFSRLLSLKIYTDVFIEKNIGLITYDEFVGYMPVAGFTSRISGGGWQDELVTIDPDGFRATGVNSTDITDDSVILTIGDSFTFGDQVSDSETWPSCIELRTKRRTLNAGVFGYGAAQAVRRASVITQQRSVDTIILSILLNDDFHRDRMNFRSGFPRPAVIQSGDGLSYAEVPPINSSGTKFQPNDVNRIIFVAKNYSILISKIINWVGFDVDGMGRTEIHENAAEIDQIIEFTVRELANINAKNRFIVLQYTRNDFPSLTSESERIKGLLFSEAQLANIPVIDTYNRLEAELTISEGSIWYGHHTPYGNQLVCDEIYQAIQNNP